MPKMIFLNLPVQDLAAATRFYEAIGCRKNPQFSDEKAASMMWSDVITFQLLTRAFYATFTAKPLADAHAASGMLIALSCDSREDVDATVNRAAESGGRADPRDPMDVGFLYNRAVEDPDGHVLELVWLNPEAMAAGADLQPEPA